MYGVSSVIYRVLIVCDICNWSMCVLLRLLVVERLVKVICVFEYIVWWCVCYVSNTVINGLVKRSKIYIDQLRRKCALVTVKPSKMA